MTDSPNDILTTAEAAEIIGLSVRYVQKLCKAGRIEHQFRGGIYWISRAEAERFAESERPMGRPSTKEDLHN